jgi:8-oxo-dGTP pyrophosphatase MutT (NUDIX family)
MSTTPTLSSLINLPGFDPRTVPVEGVDAHLPALAPSDLSLPALQARFLRQISWEPELRVEPRFTDRPPSAASVLLGIVEREQPMVLLTQRTANLSTHSGQIAFPGGRQDPGDRDLTVTALREAHEEIGLAPEFLDVLGTLPIYRTGSGFIVTPVVALLRSGYSFTRNPGEVDDIFEVPLAFLMNPANHRRHVFEWNGVRREWLSMPYHDGIAERFIWGATAGMLRNFYRFLAAR